MTKRVHAAISGVVTALIVFVAGGPPWAAFLAFEVTYHGQLIAAHLERRSA